MPLGGNRDGKVKGMRNAAITMVVSGLWHGPAWTFVIWGALHALYLAFERVTRWPRRLEALGRIGRPIAVLFTFFLTGFRSRTPMKPARSRRPSTWPWSTWSSRTARV